MIRKRLSRSAGPVRLVHLGLGNFFRAHPAWYTERAGDSGAWGYAAFAGRGAGVTTALNAQEGLYTLVTRAPEGDRFEVIGSITRAHPASDHGAWLETFRRPELAAVTVTVTEAGWLAGAGGGLDPTRPELQADLDRLRRDPTGPVRTAPARLVAGLDARRRAEGGALTVVPCDNLPHNGPRAARTLYQLAERIDPALAGWIESSVVVASTVVDRITPRPVAVDLAAVRDATGLDDRCPVVTEPFHEWVLAGEFPNGRPRWEDAGALFTADVTPFEQRKLWLLNGAHSLLAYTGSIRGHATVAQAAADGVCRAWVGEWWAEAGPHLDRPAAEIESYQAQLLKRFANTRLADRLDRIAADGSQKLRVRVLPVLRAERAAGRLPGGAVRILAAWLCHLRGLGAPIEDARAGEVVPLARGPLPEAAARIVAWLSADVGDDGELAAAIAAEAAELVA